MKLNIVKIKKALYLLCTIILGIILSYIIHAAVEITYLINADKIIWYNHWGHYGCALHPIIQYGLLLMGIVGGFFLGRWWWKIVYVEKRHWRLKKTIIKF